MTDDELPCDPDQEPLPPITPEELDALAGDMEAMHLERGDPSPEEAVAIYRAADEIRRLRKPPEETTMSQPDTPLDDLKRVAAAAPTFGGLLNRAADEIHGLSALLHRTEHEAGEEIRRLRSEVATLQAQATTYWDALGDILPIAERDTRACQWHDQDGSILRAEQAKVAKARAALAKPAT